ncbi:MAG: hypothetical protein COT17_07395 [Elusimicrobia bacterium CG08_land_8_20_14_0_20_51_18]|nr:MAG: hypothetical protein COT17_07395 [Elusimicrobia bacterium CG08_land_8_20_14_0_20_51_18]
MRKISKIIFFLAASAVCGSAEAAVFTPRQMDEITCASTKMQLFYYYISPNRSETIKDFKFKCKGKEIRYIMPKWIDEALVQMTAKKVWRDPEEGEISEANLWQTATSILYEFMEVTKKTFPIEKGGSNIQPALLVKEYSDMKIRFQMALDRLYRARLGDSFDGRGRSILAEFNLVLKEMESISDAISSSNAKQYSDAVSAISVLSQDAFSLIIKSPRNYEPPVPLNKFKQVLYNMLTIVGIILVFLAVRFFFVMNEEKNEKVMQDYNARLNKWKDEFSRQFMQVKVEYMVAVPIGVSVILGILSMNFFVFIFLVLLGTYLGFKAPTMILNAMKVRRGKKIDGQLMDALILMSNALKSGLDVVQGFEMVSKDLVPPISDEFALVIKNYQLGMTFERALGVMEDRVSSKMLSYMIRAVVLQRQIGGNLTKVFERIVIDIREESKLEEKTKALTAQQKIQSIVVGLMPWVMVSVMFMFQPDVMIRFYSTPLGMFVLVFCIVWIGIGMKVVSSLGKIRV